MTSINLRLLYVSYDTVRDEDASPSASACCHQSEGYAQHLHPPPLPDLPCPILIKKGPSSLTLHLRSSPSFHSFIPLGCVVWSGQLLFHLPSIYPYLFIIFHYPLRYHPSSFFARHFLPSFPPFLLF